MSWVAVGVGAVGLGTAAYQYYNSEENRKNDEKNRPKYEIPPEIQQNLNATQHRATTGMPDAQKQQYINNIQRSSAYSLNQLGTRNAGLTGVAAVNQNMNSAYGNLASADSQMRAQNENALSGARSQMADYRDQSFQVNKVNPYYENIARRDANLGALTQNISNSGQMIAGANYGSLNQGKSSSGGQSQYGNNYGYGYQQSPYQTQNMPMTSPAPYSGAPLGDVYRDNTNWY